jgi:hypothetical protein
MESSSSTILKAHALLDHRPLSVFSQKESMVVKLSVNRWRLLPQNPFFLFLPVPSSWSRD